MILYPLGSFNHVHSYAEPMNLPEIERDLEMFRSYRDLYGKSHPFWDNRNRDIYDLINHRNRLLGNPIEAYNTHKSY